MNKISIIIPTILRCREILEALISQLLKDSVVDEIIIINNSQKEFTYNNDKVKIYQQNENLYVNKAWNLGISLIKNDTVGIFNDDILPCDNFCSQILDSGILEQNDTGLLGMNSSRLFCKDFGELEDDLSIPEPDEFCKLTFNELTDFDTLVDWGITIFGKKNNYYQIPEELKICYGDNYLLYKNKDKKNYTIKGLPIKHIHSCSVRSRAFESILLSDMNNWDNIKQTL